MSFIVIEGPDNSGKSTLAQYLATVLGLTLQESEGKPKDANELEHRCRRYEGMTNTLFVRHPVVSNPIYCHIHGDSGPSQETRDRFYNAGPLLIYCDPLGRGLDGHVIKEHEDPAFIKGLEDGYQTIVLNYRSWALARAHVIYRIGDGFHRIEKYCRVHLGR